jgi:hypothetical protein
MRTRFLDRFPHAPAWGGLPALALIALVALACSDGQPGPTDPGMSMNAMAATKSAQLAGPAAATQAPSLTDARGHSHGHPGGGGGGQLTFEMRPDVWNTNFPKSQGFVEAFIIGAGTADIDLGSIMLSGDSATAAPLAPASTRQEDHHVVARFKMAAAFALLANPKPGETHTLTLTFTAKGTSTQLTDTVRIVGPGGPSGGGGGSLQLRIAPDVWNTNFSHSHGTVAFFVTGADARKIDVKSIQLTGDSPTAAPLSPVNVRAEDHHVVARFAMEDAFATLNDPKPGEEHKVTLSFTVNGTATTLTGEVRIVGPS